MKYKHILYSLAILIFLTAGAVALNHYMSFGKSSLVTYNINQNPEYFNKFTTSNITEQMMDNPEYFDLFTTSDTGLGVGMGGSGGFTCSIGSISNLAFGNYDPFSSSTATGTTTFTISCSGCTTCAVTITISAGGGGSFDPWRNMSGTDVAGLDYNIYKDSSRTQIWGDTSSYDLNYNNGTSHIYTIYGKINPLQNIEPGAYSDSVTVTTNW